MQKGNIGVTTDNIFPIIKKFLYSDHEIFLREIVSNAVDATQKLKTLSSVGDFKGELGDLFVEVKMRREGNIVSPAEAVDYGKRLRILQTAKDFLSKTHLEELQPRFDVAEVFYETNDNNEKHYKLHYIKNAFGE